MNHLKIDDMQQFKIPMKHVKPVYRVSINQALNGYGVIVEEVPQMYDSSNMPSFEEQMSFVKKAIDIVNPESDNELQRIYMENNIKPESSEEPKIKKVGYHVFKTFSELTAFLSFIYDNEQAEGT